MSDNEHTYEIDQSSGDFMKLLSLLDKEGAKAPITVPVQASVADILLMLLYYFLQHTLSHTAVTNLFKLINFIFAEPIIPDTKYLIDTLFMPTTGVKYHAVCSNCQYYLGVFEKKQTEINCEVCKSNVTLKNLSNKDFFITIDPSASISNILQKYSKDYVYNTKTRIHEKGDIKDMFDGKKYRNIVKELKEEGVFDYVTLTFNSDGAPVF